MLGEEAFHVRECAYTNAQMFEMAEDPAGLPAGKEGQNQIVKSHLWCARDSFITVFSNTYHSDQNRYWMNGWMDGWVGGWVGGWMDGRTDGRTDG